MVNAMTQDLTAGDIRPAPPPRQRRPVMWALIVLAVVLVVGGAAWWLRSQVPASPPPPAAAAPVLEPPSALPAPTPAPAPVAEAPQPEPPAAPQPLAADGVRPALETLFGKKALASLLQPDDFLRRLVVTVDNLARPHAPAPYWPVRPTAGRFTVVERGGATLVSPDNADRYTPLVLLAERTDSKALVALYVRALPLLQQAYEEAGYPKQRFHTRLIAVIDHLLAAPQAPELIPVHLTEVKGDVPSTRPWLRYEFADPDLEAASAGQKIMVRVGAVNERRLKAKLRELRAELLHVSSETPAR